jgi:hypothetical protein
MKLSKAQKLVLESMAIHAKNNASVVGYKGYHSKDLEGQFNIRTINKLLDMGLIYCDNHSRLRTDDMEMVYWRTYRLVPTPLMKALD